MGRFDYITYDETSQLKQAKIKNLCVQLSDLINESIECPRSVEKAQTHLEEVYMWTGKGIRNDQVMRSTLPPTLDEARTST